MTKILAAFAFVSSVLLAAPASAALPACLANPLPEPTQPVFSREVTQIGSRNPP
jgi:hypothetical protein